MRVAHPGNAMNQLACTEVKHFDCLVFFGRKEKTVTLEIDTEVVEVT
jgi:hypothetical protein